jgi:hypothetical protein
VDGEAFLGVDVSHYEHSIALRIIAQVTYQTFQRLYDAPCGMILSLNLHVNDSQQRPYSIRINPPCPIDTCSKSTTNCANKETSRAAHLFDLGTWKDPGMAQGAIVSQLHHRGLAEQKIGHRD